MDSQGSQPEQPSRRSLAQNLPALVAAYLASLAVIAYPLGLFTLWTQIWMFYTHDSFTAIYAASLIPVPAATSKALSVLDLLIITGTGAWLISMVFIQSRVYGHTRLLARSRYPRLYHPVYQRISHRVHRRVGDTDEGLGANGFLDTHETLFSFLRNTLRPDSKLIFALSILLVLQSAMVPLVFGDIWFGRVIPDSFSDILLYGWYLFFVFLGGTWGAFLIHGRPPERGNLIAGILVIYAGALLAAMALIPLRHPSLPVAKFTDSPVEEAILISHQAGYWYVLQEDERSLTAIPDDEAGTVSISDPFAE